MSVSHRELFRVLCAVLCAAGLIACDGRTGTVGTQSRLPPRSCAVSDTCPNEQPVCGSAGTCTGCTENTDCNGGASCSPRGACVECLNDTQCDTATEACSPEGRCETRCSTTLPCDTGEVCATTASVCAECTPTDVTQCDQDKPMCDPLRLRCTECVSNLDCDASSPICVGGSCESCYDSSDCALGEICGSNFECSMTCTSDATCTDGDASHCSLPSGQCVACLTDDHCSADVEKPLCVATECVECRTSTDCADPTPNCVDNQCES